MKDEVPRPFVGQRVKKHFYKHYMKLRRVK